MLESIHEEMTRDALQGKMGARALEAVIAANVKQDAFAGQLHREYHFDNDLHRSTKYMNEQRGVILFAMMNQSPPAWSAFGRLIHAAQDFYSHTNYVTLWLSLRGSSHPTPLEIDPVDRNLIHSPDLRAAKLYHPLEWMYFVRPLRGLSMKLLPRDSHAWMNLDSPERGSNFEFARVAAVKRTIHEFDIIRKLFKPDAFAQFTAM